MAKAKRPAFAEEDDLLIGPPHLSRWGYACSKLMDEFLALAHARERKTPVVIARLFNTVGPRQTGQYGMVLPRFLLAARRGEPLRVYGDGRQTRCFCYVLGHGGGAGPPAELPRRARTGFQCRQSEEIGIRRLAELVIEILHSPSRIELVPYEKAYPPGFEDMRRRKPVLDRLAACTGFRPATTLREIVAKTAALTLPA